MKTHILKPAISSLLGALTLHGVTVKMSSTGGFSLIHLRLLLKLYWPLYAIVALHSTLFILLFQSTNMQNVMRDTKRH